MPAVRLHCYSTRKIWLAQDNALKFENQSWEGGARASAALFSSAMRALLARR